VRVLHVIDSLVLGGAEQLLVTLARHIDTARFDMRVCSLTGTDQQAPIPATLRNHDVSLYWLPGRRHDPRHLPWLASLIRQERIDLVHSHLAYGNVVGLQAAALARRPAVSTIHSIQDRHPSLATLKERLQGRALRRHSQVVIACSSEVGRTARERFGISLQKLCVVPNGVDTDAYDGSDRRAAAAQRRELLGDHVGPLVVSVGNVSRPKSHEILVDAVARLVGTFPGLRVVIVGREGDNSQRVRHHIASEHLEDRVILRGERADVPSTLAAADLFVDSSRWHGLPLAILEAMAVGVPIVATAVGETPKLQESGGLVQVVPPGDAVVLAGAMADLLGDRCRARVLATSARAYVRAEHDASRWAQQLEAIYTRVVDERDLEHTD
jgi:glycosyltransferase involved in cell wall biosynthesis